MPSLAALSRFGTGGFKGFGAGTPRMPQGAMGYTGPSASSFSPTLGGAGAGAAQQQYSDWRKAQPPNPQAQSNYNQAYYGVMGAQGLPGMAQAFGTFANAANQTPHVPGPNPNRGSELGGAPAGMMRVRGGGIGNDPGGGWVQRGPAGNVDANGNGLQSGYQTPQQLLAAAQSGMDLNTQMGPGGSLLRQLMNAGPQALAGADPALLAKIKAAATGAYQNQIDQNNAMKGYWGQEGNNPSGAIDTGLYDRSIAQFLQQMGRWA